MRDLAQSPSARLSMPPLGSDSGGRGSARNAGMEDGELLIARHEQSLDRIPDLIARWPAALSGPLANMDRFADAARVLTRFAPNLMPIVATPAAALGQVAQSHQSNGRPSAVVLPFRRPAASQPERN